MLPRVVQLCNFRDYRAVRCVAENSRSSLCRRCSKLCSDRVGKRQIGTRQDRISIRRFLAGNRESRRDSRQSDPALVGLANRRLQPLGHLTAARNLSIRRGLSYGEPSFLMIVPEIVPASLRNRRENGVSHALAALIRTQRFFSTEPSPKLLIWSRFHA